ncbi:MAG: Crp/Fnr family transcriptional regulator [Hyphomicrobiales bacterium]
MTLDARITTLHNCAFFSVVPEPDLLLLAEAMHEEQFGEGDLVCEAGDPADRVYVVASGALKVEVPGADGATREIGPGDLVGEYGLFGDGTRSATITCLAPVTLLAMDYPRFNAFLVTFPEATVSILRRTVKRLLVLESRAG